MGTGVPWWPCTHLGRFGAHRGRDRTQVRGAARRVGREMVGLRANRPGRAAELKGSTKKGGKAKGGRNSFARLAAGFGCRLGRSWCWLVLPGSSRMGPCISLLGHGKSGKCWAEFCAPPAASGPS